MAKPLRLGLRAGNHGLKWSVYYLERAGKEAKDLLNSSQHRHVLDAIRALAGEEDPRRPACEEVSPIDDFHELKLKGGLLGKINLRVFFDILDDQKAILLVHAWKKEAEAQTPSHVKRTVSKRLREFREGLYGSIA